MVRPSSVTVRGINGATLIKPETWTTQRDFSNYKRHKCLTQSDQKKKVLYFLFPFLPVLQLIKKSDIIYKITSLAFPWTNILKNN